MIKEAREISPFDIAISIRNVFDLLDIEKKKKTFNNPKHIEFYIKGIGFFSAKFPTIRINQKSEYDYIVYKKLTKKEQNVFKKILLSRVGAFYDFTPFIHNVYNFLHSALRNIGADINKMYNQLMELMSQINAYERYNCVTLFKDIVPFEVNQEMTPKEFLDLLLLNGWSIIMK